MPSSFIKIYPYGVEFTIRLAVIYLLIAMISFWFEFFRDHYRQGMEEERQRLTTEIADQHRAETTLQQANQQLRSILDNIHAHVYIADPASHKILFMNRKMQDDFGGNRQGELCWQAFRNAKLPCDHCTISRLLDPCCPEKVIAWEGYNPLTRRWYANVDQVIVWTEQQPAKLQIAIEIPAPDDRAQRPDHAAQMPVSGTPTPGDTKKVLVVDDELLMRQMVTMILEKLGCTVLTAVDGVDAVTLFHQHHEDIALVLCDLCMPRMNGWETLAALRTIAPELLFVLSSGQKVTWEENPSAEHRPSAILEKPYTLGRLRALLEQFSIIQTSQSPASPKGCQAGIRQLIR